MFDNTESILPRVRKPDGSPKKLEALILGVDDESLDELERLLQTLDVQISGRILAPIKRITPATYVGAGKLDEAKALVEELKADALILDLDVSPNQLRNIEAKIGKPVLDRSGVIIEIFSQHARTRESKTQVELARVQYLLPRLAHFWSHFERQRGGGVGNKGMGEKQLEVDRRLLKKRIQLLEKRLSGIEKERKVQRGSRQDVLKVAFVGYTNAGKSTLLNAITLAKVLAEDKLFSTLDSCVRALDPDSHPPIVAIDTVGFISRIPTSLIASFRSTLEELEQADLLIHVVDGSSPGAQDQIAVTEKVLAELGLENKPRMVVLNKMDCVKTAMRTGLAKLLAPGAIRLSALNPSDTQRLRDKILDYFRERLSKMEVVIPYSESKLEAKIRAYGHIETQRYLEKGTFYRLRISDLWIQKLGLARFGYHESGSSEDDSEAIVQDKKTKRVSNRPTQKDIRNRVETSENESGQDPVDRSSLVPERVRIARQSRR